MMRTVSVASVGGRAVFVRISSADLDMEEGAKIGSPISSPTLLTSHSNNGPSLPHRLHPRPRRQAQDRGKDISARRPQLVEHHRHRPPRHPFHSHERWPKCDLTAPVKSPSTADPQIGRPGLLTFRLDACPVLACALHLPSHPSRLTPCCSVRPRSLPHLTRSLSRRLAFSSPKKQRQSPL